MRLLYFSVFVIGAALFAEHGPKTRTIAEKLPPHLNERIRVLLKEIDIDRLLEDRKNIAPKEGTRVDLLQARRHRQRIGVAIDISRGLLSDLEKEPESPPVTEAKTRVHSIEKNLMVLQSEALSWTMKALSDSSVTKASLEERMGNLEMWIVNATRPKELGNVLKELRTRTEEFELMAEETVYLTQKHPKETGGILSKLEKVELKFLALLEYLESSRSEFPKYNPVPNAAPAREPEAMYHPSLPSGDPVYEGVQRLMKDVMIPLK